MLADKDWIKQQAFQGTEYTDAECEVVLKLGRILWPFVPNRDAKHEAIAHVALRAPIALIANSLLRFTGYHEFTRKIAPTFSTSSLHGLGLNAVGLYEVLCSAGKNHYDVNDASGKPLTDAAKITNPVANKRAIFEAFFNMDKVDKLCNDHGLSFHDR